MSIFQLTGFVSDDYFWYEEDYNIQKEDEALGQHCNRVWIEEHGFQWKIAKENREVILPRLEWPKGNVF